MAVMLAVAALHPHAYGVPIQRALSVNLGRDVSFGAVYTTLDRLERKGLISSETGEPTPSRGGRAKKFFFVEALGQEALDAARRAVSALWAMDSVRSGA